MRRSRGLTMIELLVSASLLAVLATLVAQTMAPAARVWNRNQSRSAVEQQALLLREKVTREVMATSADSLTVGSSAFAFMATDGYDPQDGDARWSRYVVYCLDRQNRILYRKIWPNPARTLQVPAMARVLPSDEPKPVTASQLDALCLSTNGTEEVAARHVSGLSVTRSGSRLALTLQFVIDAPEGLETRTFSTVVRARN